MAGPRALWLLMLGASCGGASPQALRLSPKLARALDAAEERDFAVLGVSGGDVALLNGLLGTSLPCELSAASCIEEARQCVPDAAALAAFALADVWLAVLPSGPGSCELEADRLFSRIFAALEQLPAEDEFRPRRVLLVDTVAGAGAQTEQPSLGWLSARASALWRSRLQPASVGLEKLCSFDLVRLPGNTTAGASDDTSSQGAQLLLRFGKPEAPNSLLVRPRMVPAEIGLSSLPCLVRELQHNIRLRRAEWGEATRSELAASAARKLADGAAASLTRAQTDELRPLDNFQERVRNLRTQVWEAFRYTEGLASTDACELKRAELGRYLTATQLRLVRKHVEALRADQFDSFRAELAVKMATARSYSWATRKLLRKHARLHSRAARAALPGELLSYRKQVIDRSVRIFRRQLIDEVGLHKDEAADLPPLADNSRRAVWWRQILAQLIGIGLNLVQAYLLQYLPSRMRDVANERALPRGPLF